MNTPPPNTFSVPERAARWLGRPATYVGMSLGILALDLLTGPFILFPILFVLPVSLAAWFYSVRWAYALSILLPAGRLVIAEFVDTPSPFIYIVANALIRVVVLGFMAFLVGRTARQKRALEERVAGLVTMCAWSRTVEFQGEWISFEEYLKRRFNVDTSHSISPAEAKKAFGHLKSKNPDKSTEKKDGSV